MTGWLSSLALKRVPGDSVGRNWNCGVVMEMSAGRSADVCVQLADFLQGRRGVHACLHSIYIYK